MGAPASQPADVLEVDLDGGLARVQVISYDPRLVEQVKALPGRRFIRQRREWVLPARREALADLAQLIEDLDGRVAVSPRAQRRLRRASRGRIDWHEGVFELTFVPDPARLKRVRALPDRTYVRHRRCWTVPATRGGALALLELVRDDQFTASASVLLCLDRVAEARASDPNAARERSETGALRASPHAHWRHVTKGPIYHSRNQRRQWVEKVGWCVRIRVDPARRRSQR